MYLYIALLLRCYIYIRLVAVTSIINHNYKPETISLLNKHVH